MPFGFIFFREIWYSVFFPVFYLVLYGCLLFLPVPRRFFHYLLILVFISELFGGYEKVITRRHALRKDDRTYSLMTGKHYDDFQKLMRKNDEFARTELSVKIPRPVMTANLPMLFSVPGASAYNSLRPAILRTLAPEQIWENNPNVFEIRESYLANRLLGIKRKVVNHGGIPALGSFRDQSGEWKLFEMPKCQFGYVLPSDAECPAPPRNTACQDRFLLMYAHWWKTPDKVESADQGEQYEPGKGFYRFMHQPEGAVEVYRPLTTDYRLCPDWSVPPRLPYIFPPDRPLRIDLPKMSSKTGMYVLFVEAASFAFANFEISNCFAESRFPLFMMQHRYVFFIPFQNISSITISAAEANSQFCDMELIYDTDFSSRMDELSAKIDASTVSHVKFDHDAWSAEVENRSGKDAMLCVPFSYIPGWTATVNGEAVPVENINNGLLGVRLPRTGRHHVVLCWASPGRDLTRIISLGALAALLGYAVSLLWRKKHPPVQDAGSPPVCG